MLVPAGLWRRFIQFLSVSGLSPKQLMNSYSRDLPSPRVRLVVRSLIVILLACCVIAGLLLYRSYRAEVNERANKSGLVLLRRAIQAYYGEKGAFPEDIKELVPNYLPGIPVARVKRHSAVNSVRHISGKDFRAKKFADSGGWAYVNVPGDSDWGLLFLDCTHHTEGPGEKIPWTGL